MINPIEVINEGTREVNTKAGEFKIPKKIIITDTLKRILLLPLCVNASISADIVRETYKYVKSTGRQL